MGSSVGCGLSSGEELKKPYPFQEADLETLADNDWTGIVPIEPGGGKSPLSVFATVRSGAKVTLVVAPKNTLKNAWIKSYREFAGIEARIIGNGLKAERDALADFELGFPGVYLCSTQFMTRADISEWWGDLCIVDEALDVETPILTTKGWSTMGDLEYGDYVFDQRGNPTKVVNALPVMHDKPCFRLTFSTGESIVADPGHKWVARPQCGSSYSMLKERVVTTQEMFDRGTRWDIQGRPSVQLPEKNLPVDPYLLGQWLGNGSRKQPNLCVRRDLTTALTSELSARGVVSYVSAAAHEQRSDIDRVHFPDHWRVLKSEHPDTWSHKAIPPGYLTSSEKQRLDLLRGLMDSDGYVGDSGLCTFTNTNQSLINGVRDLARSLGFKVNKVSRVQDNRHTRKTCFRVTFKGTQGLSPFLLRGESYRDLTTKRAHYVVSIEPVESRPVRCISIESPDHLFLAGKELVPTHNCHNVSKAGSKGQRKLSQYKFGDPTPLSKRFTHRLALSGTPFRNSFERAWAIMRFLWPDLNAREQIAYYDYYMWCKARMTSEEVVTGFEWVTYPIEEARVKWIGGVKHWGKVTKATKWLRESEPGRLLSEAPCVIRHFRREHCCEFHPNGFLPLDEPTVTERVVELLPAQKKAIRELEDHYMTWLDSKPLVTELTITQRQRIRQVCLGVPTLTIGVNDEGDDITTVTFDTDCPSPFYEELTNILEELGDEPVAVYLESQKFARVITERLNDDGYSAFEYSGQTTKDREENLTKFGTEYRILVGVISAVGVGTDGIQNVCNNEVWIEQSVDETMNTQTQARTDRLGAKKQVQRFVILDDLGYAAGAMNARLAKALELRKSLVSK